MVLPGSRSVTATWPITVPDSSEGTKDPGSPATSTVVNIEDSMRSPRSIAWLATR